MFDPLRECVCGESILPLDRHYGYFVVTIAGSFYNAPTKFYLKISDGGIDEVVHGHEASFVRSPKGLAKLFSHALFESEQVRTRLKIFNDERFYKLVNLYFFDLVAFNIEEYQLYIDSIIADTLSK